MAMTLDSTLAQAIEHFDSEPLHHDDAIAWQVIRIHLSAQAKVRVTDEDVERAKRRLYAASGEEVADWALRKVLEDFAARLSQGAQGDGISVGVDVTNDGIGVVVRRFDTIIYSEFVPAERAAVPDGLKVSRWVSDPNAFHFEIPFNKTSLTACDVEATDAGEHADFLREMAKAMLTAAPQPPEGARVDDVASRIRKKLPFIRARTGNMLFDAGVNDACDKIEEMLAAPTLAGKEGA